MNILHLNDKVEIKGGVEVYIQQLIKILPENNVKAYWLGIYEKQDSYNIKSYLSKDEEQVKISFDQLNNYLKDFIAAYSIDIIHIHSLSNPQIIRACFNLAPVIRSMHEPRIVCPGQGKFWRKSERICNKPFGLHCIYHAYKEGCCNRHPKRLLKAYQNVAFETNKGAKEYKAVIAMSDYMKKEAIIAGYSKINLVLNPYFTPFVKEKKLCDCSEDITKSLLFMGRLSRTKGVHYFIQASLELLKKGHNIKLDIVGDGHDKMFFESLIPELYKEHFIFHGWQSRDEINSFLKKCYLLVFPSIYPEAFGISGIEAMMYGKPAVGFDVGGVSTWLKNGKTGFLVPPKNTNELTKKIDILIKNKDLYKKMSSAARMFSVSNFIPSIHMTKLRETYKNVVDK